MESFANRSPLRDPLIGRVLHDRYRVEKRIGKGGMGIVYLAEHVLLRRKVALKTLSERAFASDELIARFHREATAAAAIGNEHVVGVTDMGQLEDGSYFVVLEYLDGVELAHAVAEEGGFAVRRAVHVIMQLCEALTAVHAAGIVHRDLKPENLFLVERKGKRDFLKVLDFGVCKARDREHHAPLTHTGASLGTPQFMAPEQIENSAAVDARTDIYAAGAILFFALTGRPPFDEATLPRLFLRICSEPPPPIRASRPELSIALEAVIARAMARDPDDRFQTSEELRVALQPFTNDDTPFISRVSGISRVMPVSSPTSATLELLPAPRVSRPHIVRGAVVALAACIVLAVVAALSSRPPEPRASTDNVTAADASQTTTAVTLDLSPAFEPEPPVAASPPASNAKRAAKHPKRDALVTTAEAATTPPSQPAPELPPATQPAVPPPPTEPAAPSSAYRLSQRELKDVFP